MVNSMSTITPTLVIAVIALISPIITNWINNRHLEREKVLDFTNNHLEKMYDKKIESIESYLKAAYKLKQHVENANADNMSFGMHETLISTIEDLDNKGLVPYPDEFKKAVINYNEALGNVLPFVELETKSQLLEIDTLIDSGESIGNDLSKPFSRIVAILHKEIDGSKPDYNEYRPKEIKDIFLRVFKHVDITKKSNKNN